MTATTKNLFDKKTFHINREYTTLMKKIIPNRKQTDFVNRAIKHELEREHEKIERQKTLKNLEKLRIYRQSLPKSEKPSEEILAEMRNERIDHLYNLSSKTNSDD